MGSLDRLARDLERWSARLETQGYSVTARDALEFQAARKTALWLMRDVRPDIARQVGGRTLDAGKGRRARGYRAGVWAAMSTKQGNGWWFGGTGKLHWLDQGTTAHTLQPKRRGRRKKQPIVPMRTPKGPRIGPFHHRGARPSHLYQRAVRAHADAAMRAGGADIADRIRDAVML